MKITLLILLTIPLIGFGRDSHIFEQEIVFQQFCDTIPFEYIRNKMIVEVKINKQKKRFIFDTGATSCISDITQSQMNNSILDTTFLTDLSGLRQKVFIVSVKQLILGTLTFENVPSAVINIESTGLANCLNYDGIIGSNLLTNCVVYIDTKRKHIILTDNINKLNLQNAFQSTLTLDNQGSPYIQLSLNDKIKFNALFDSGASDFISISDKVVEKILKSNIGKVLNKGYGIGAIGAFGIEKASHKKRVLCNNVKFGKFEITNFVTEVSNQTESIMGMELADYGTITIDYINKLFYFTANQQKQPYKYQKTLGFSFQPESNYYSIATVWTGTQAEKMGLKSGYQILKLNDLDISKRTQTLDCQLLLTRPLSKQKVKLTYKDDKNQIKIVEFTEE
jgi:predicted aspartyl protease